MARGFFAMLFWLALASSVRADTPKADLSVSAATRSQAVRDGVIERWQLPRLTEDATVRVRAQVLLSGAVVEPEIEVVGAEGEVRKEVMRSVEQAIARGVAQVPPGRVEFSVRVRGGSHTPACLPLRVYVPSAMEDSLEPMPPTSVAAMRSAAERWNLLVKRHGSAEVGEPFVLVDQPDGADVRIRAFERYGDYSSYLLDEATGQVTVNVPIKELRHGLFASGYRWWNPEVVTRQTLFQLGRLLGLPPADHPQNIMFPGHSSEAIYVPKTPEYDTQSGGEVISYMEVSNSPSDGNLGRFVSRPQLAAIVANLQTRRCGEPTFERSQP